MFVYEQSMTFYLGRPVTLVSYWDEFAFGLRQQPQLSVPALDAFYERWRAHTTRHEKALAIVGIETMGVMQGHGLQFRILAQDSRRAVLTNM
ncbi:hypothetical protein [Duganella sp. P38]|uniref:hypothetical protein n=1 Tax=Duganella sp. P38 TaxID=3423949 RepID=UPI003D79F9B0